MKSIIKVEIISGDVFVSFGEHVLKTYNGYGRELFKTIRLGERFAKKYIEKYFTDGGIIETWDYFTNTLITRIEY